MQEFQYGTDQPILEKLQQSNNPLIRHYLNRLDNISSIFDVVKYEEAADMKVNNLVLRAVDPRVKLGDNEHIVKLSAIDNEFKFNINMLRDWCANGYGIRFNQDEKDVIAQLENDLSLHGSAIQMQGENSLVILSEQG